MLIAACALIPDPENALAKVPTLMSLASLLIFFDSHIVSEHFRRVSICHEFKRFLFVASFAELFAIEKCISIFESSLQIGAETVDLHQFRDFVVSKRYARDADCEQKNECFHDVPPTLKYRDPCATNQVISAEKCLISREV
jgi:hypothetical protein